MTFCQIFVAVKFEVKLHLSPYRACGSGGLANSLGGANCVPYTCSVSVVPRPSPKASLQYARPASRRLQYGYRKRREAERGPGKEASSACCERLPEQQAGSSLLFTSVQIHSTTVRQATKRAASRR